MYSALFGKLLLLESREELQCFWQFEFQPWTVTMTSLPHRVPNRLWDIADVISVYSICLRLEKSLQLAIDKGNYVGNTQIYIRILGYLIHYVPTNQGLKHHWRNQLMCRWFCSSWCWENVLWSLHPGLYVYASTSTVQHAIWHAHQFEPIRVAYRYPPMIHLLFHLIQ